MNYFKSGIVILSAVGLLSIGAKAEPNEPAVLGQFQRLLKTDGAVSADSVMVFPVTVVETAYEHGKGWCAAHYRQVPIKSPEKLRPYLAALRKAWAGKPIAAGNTPSYYGLSGQGDCEHYWAVKLDQRREKVIGLVVDASDNEWTPSRKGFTLKELP